MVCLVIFGAERFGLSQLHQLRGRVGRGEDQSTCYLCPGEASPKALERLLSLCRTQDGFELARMDLGLRGAGNLFGTQQSGLLDFRFASWADTDVMARAQQWAKTIMIRDSKLDSFPLLRGRIKEALEEIHAE